MPVREVVIDQIGGQFVGPGIDFESVPHPRIGKGFRHPARKRDQLFRRVALGGDATRPQIAAQFPAQLWGKTDQDCRPPDIDTIAADNLYTGHINNLRVALWAVAWTQTFFFDHGVPP